MPRVTNATGSDGPAVERVKISSLAAAGFKCRSRTRENVSEPVRPLSHPNVQIMDGILTFFLVVPSQHAPLLTANVMAMRSTLTDRNDNSS